MQTALPVLQQEQSCRRTLFPRQHSALPIENDQRQRRPRQAVSAQCPVCQQQSCRCRLSSFERQRLPLRSISDRGLFPEEHVRARRLGESGVRKVTTTTAREDTQSVTSTDSTNTVTLRAIWPWFRPAREIVIQQATSSSSLPPPPPLPKPRSIFKSEGRYSSGGTASTKKISSIESDIPSLASSTTSEVDVVTTSTVPTCQTVQAQEQQQQQTEEPPAILTRASSESIRFDPCVTIREFERSKLEEDTCWFSEEDLDQFKCSALQRIRAHDAKHQQEQPPPVELIPTGTGRFVSKRVITKKKRPQKILFSHRALQADDTAEPELSFPQNILIVDSHDICAALFAKSLRNLFPSANTITTTTNSQDALAKFRSSRYDMVIVEERLKKLHNTSWQLRGSDLIRQFLDSQKVFVVGVSAHLERDGEILRRVGAHAVWSKPPPCMNQAFRRDLVERIRSVMGEE